MTLSLLLFLHLVSFAAYVGAGFAQNNFLKASAGDALAPAIRAEYERLAAAIVTKIELPAIFGAIVSGIGFLGTNPALMRQGWLHAKLTCVLLLAVLSHLEMFNARRIVRAREGAASDAEAVIASRKKRHALFGTIGSLLVVVLLALVTFARLA